MASSQAPPARFVALDIRKQAVIVGAVDAKQRVVLTPRQVAHGALDSWMRQHLRPTDAVVVESPTNVWAIHDQLAQLVASVTIAHPQLAGLMPATHPSPGTSDAIQLARLHAAGLVPALWVPSPAVRELRALTAHRRRLLAQRSEARELLHELLRRYCLTPPGADRLAADRPDWWASRGLAPNDLARAQSALHSLSRAAALLTEAEAELEQCAGLSQYVTQVAALLQVPAMRRLDAIILLAEIGTVARFPNASQLVGYAGLAGGAQSGDQQGHTNQNARDGRRDIRATMLEVARSAVRADAHWREVFEALEQRAGRSRAIVATARKMLVLVWETLSAQAAAAGEGQMRYAA